MKAVAHQRKGWLINFIRFAFHFGRAFPKFFIGTEIKNCSLCGSNSRFLAFGQPPRFDAMCPSCGGLERHRFFALWMNRNLHEVAGKDVLHFAPEEMIAERLRSYCKKYVGADIREGKADMAINIERMTLQDCSFDAIICLHVLEHVNDELALSEMHRVLSVGGIAILMFPIVEGWDRTLEEHDLPGVVFSAPNRTKYFGQHDHVRYYGKDVRGRIEAAGFLLEEVTSQEPDVSAHGLLRGERIFIARKPY